MNVLAGFVGFTDENKDIITNMLNTMSSDSELESKTYTSDSCVLGQKQTTPNACNEILYSNIETAAILFSGKIYNFSDINKELCYECKNDAELVVRGYIRWGKHITEKLHGMFAFAIWDETEKTLLLARDSAGTRPLYYSSSDNTFIFSSRLKAFDKHPSFKKAFNNQILSSYLCFNSVPTKETFFKNVFRLEAGHRLVWKNGTVIDECFSQLEFQSESNKEDEHILEIQNAVSNTIKQYTDNVNFASMLSGGIDSSYIVSLAKPKNAYTVGYHNNQYDETCHSTQLCDTLGINNIIKRIDSDDYLDKFEEIVYCMDEPLADPSAVALYFGMQEASKDVDVVLSGEGADELFGGYNSYMEELTHQKYMKKPYFIRHLIYLATCNLPESRKFNFFYRRGQKLENFHIGLDRIFKDKNAKRVLRKGKYLNTREITRNCYQNYNTCSTLQQRQAIDYYFWLINDFVHSVVGSAEHFGIEARFPFLSHEVQSIAKKLTDKEKLTINETKPALRRAAKDFVPTDAYKRKKLGFPVPLKEWIKGDKYYNKIKDKFSGETAKQFFKQKQILKLLEDHRQEKRDCYKQIWTIYTFLVWYDLYFR